MDFISVFIIAIGLSFDSFAVSLGCGAMQSRIAFGRAMKIAFFMGLFQGLFPVLGFYMGSTLNVYVESFDHWIAFGILVFLGVRMIIDSRGTVSGRERKIILKNSSIIAMAVGTSIDALAVGISFAFIYDKIWFEALLIGLITFIASMTAIRIGKSAGPRLGSLVETTGGLLLIAIGVKILLEHTVLA
ncbi:MAG: manganese efflux pump [Bacteroidales bacterium]|nr:manganese efflux pump [Bacteroidales bacterium]